MALPGKSKKLQSWSNLPLGLASEQLILPVNPSITTRKESETALRNQDFLVNSYSYKQNTLPLADRIKTMFLTILRITYLFK